MAIAELRVICYESVDLELNISISRVTRFLCLLCLSAVTTKLGLIINELLRYLLEQNGELFFYVVRMCYRNLIIYSFRSQMLTLVEDKWTNLILYGMAM